MEQKQNIKRSLKEQFYFNILSWYQNKGIKITNETAIIGALQDCFVVDRKYQRVCEYVMKRYEKTQNNNNSGKYRIKYYSLLAAFVLYVFLSRTNLKSVIAEEDIASMLEELKIEITGEEKTPEISIEYLEEAKKLEEARILQEQIEEVKEIYEEEKRLEKQYEEYLEREEQQRIGVYESFLEEYSGYFHLNSEKVKELAQKTTNNYEDFASILPNKDFDFTNPEAVCMLFVYYLNRDELTIKLNEFGISKEELLTTTEIETASYSSLEELILRNGNDYTHYVGKICDLFNIRDKTMMLSVSYSEIGKTGSPASRNNNNFAGLLSRDGEILTFSSPEAGIIAICGNFKNAYNHYDLNNLKELARHYVKGPNGKYDAEAEGWLDHFKSFYSEISENYDLFFGMEEEADYTLVRTRTE